VTAALDAVMPRYDVNEIHETWVAAPPELAFATLTALTGREIRLLGPLMAIRGVPYVLRGRRMAPSLSGPVLDAFRRAGFVELGAVGRFWSPSGNQPLRTIRNRDDFVAFAEPGYAKAAMSFVVEPSGAGSRVVTETRIVGTDERATRLFRRYWLVIGWGSAAIRRSWLKALSRRVAARGTAGV
jgi:hypothetical protein